MTDLTRCSCTRLNNAWRKFCGGCGAHLGPACACGFVNSTHDRFCGGCGVAIAAAATRGRVGSAPPVPKLKTEATQPIDILHDLLPANDPR